MTNRADDALEGAVASILSAKDVVDLLAVLLTICRRHPGELTAAGQDRALRARRIRVSEEAAAVFSSRGLTARTRSFAIDALRQAENVAEAARALALGIDLAVRGRDSRDYVRLCLKFGTRTLQEGDPYPTPSANLAAMYGPGGFSRRPRRGSEGTAVDCVEGLALWPSKVAYPFDVVYDTVAGSYLDAALDQSLDVLTVSPNQSLANEFAVDSHSPSGFFGVRVIDCGRQDDIICRAIKRAHGLSVNIVITPELSSTPDTLARIVGALQEVAEGGSRRSPGVVVAGGAHMEVDGKRVNRMTTVYAGRSPYFVTHDKVAKYAMDIPEGETVVEHEEDIDRSVQLRIHAGITWSMVTLICADFLDPTVVRAVSDLCPRIVVVPAMSRKTADFERRIGELIANCQAFVAVVNGPAEWIVGSGVRSAVTLFGMPLADSSKAVLPLTPDLSAEAPFTSHFESRTRGAKFIAL